MLVRSQEIPFDGEGNESTSACAVGFLYEALIALVLNWNSLTASNLTCLLAISFSTSYVTSWPREIPFLIDYAGFELVNFFFFFFQPSTMDRFHGELSAERLINAVDDDATTVQDIEAEEMADYEATQNGMLEHCECGSISCQGRQL